MFKRVVAAAVLALALAGGLAKAEEVFVSFKVLSPAVALELAQATLEACRNEGYQVSVAVVDRSGITQVILRDRYAGPHTPETARRKAWTAVSFRTDTLEMTRLTQAGQEQSGVRQVTGAMLIGGGVPVEARRLPGRRHRGRGRARRARGRPLCARRHRGDRGQDRVLTGYLVFFPGAQ